MKLDDSEAQSVSVQRRRKATTDLRALCHGGLGPAIWEARSLIGMAEDCEFLPADDPLHERVAAEIEAWIPLFLGVLAGCATVGEWRAWVARYVTGDAK